MLEWGKNLAGRFKLAANLTSLRSSGVICSCVLLSCHIAAQWLSPRAGRTSQIRIKSGCFLPGEAEEVGWYYWSTVTVDDCDYFKLMISIVSFFNYDCSLTFTSMILTRSKILFFSTLSTYLSGWCPTLCMAFHPSILPSTSPATEEALWQHKNVIPPPPLLLTSCLLKWS